MISIGIKRVASALTGGRIAAIAMSAIVVAACAAPGAVSSPSAAATATTAPATVAPSVGASDGPIRKRRSPSVPRAGRTRRV